jgi:hypothetical protein
VPESAGLGTQRALALTAGGVGVAGVVVGSIFGLTAKSKHDAAGEYCSGRTCTDQRGVDLTNDALSAGNVATAGFVVGAVGLAAGAVLWFTATSAQEGASAPRVGVGPGRIVVQGAW